MDLSTEAGVALFLHSRNIRSSQVTRLSEGFSAYVFRTELEDPLPDGSTTIIVKHYADYAARAKQFLLDSTRSSFEYTFLTAIPSLLPPSLSTTNLFPLVLPKAHTYSLTYHAILLQDFHPSTSLQHYIRKPATCPSPTAAKAIGHSLGLFLASVHNTSLTRPDILSLFATNDSCRRLSAKAYFERLHERAVGYGFPFAGHPGSPAHERMIQTTEIADDGAWLKHLGEREADIVLRGPRDGEEEVLTVGDFWPGNILVTPEQSLVALDFEYAKPGRASFDLGAMVAELWMIHALGPWPGVDFEVHDDAERKKAGTGHGSAGSGALEDGTFISGEQREQVVEQVKAAAMAVLTALLHTYKEEARMKVDPAQVAIRIGAHLVNIGPMGREAVFGRERITELVRFGTELCRAGMENRKSGWKQVLGDF